MRSINLYINDAAGEYSYPLTHYLADALTNHKKAFQGTELQDKVCVLLFV